MKLDKDIIGMLHIPVNTVLAAPKEWRGLLGLPSAYDNDRNILAGFAEWAARATKLERERVLAAAEAVEKLSFYGYLRDRMFSEADVYARNGVDVFMLENIGAPYFLLPEPIQGGIAAVMMALSAELRREYPASDRRIGLQILAYSDPLAMSVACFAGLDFMRSEGALFEGERPEGRNANTGTLAKLYIQRADLAGDGVTPRVYVDLQKKHTVFSDGLRDLGIWLDNVVFQKLEGVIITGTGTGVPVVEADLANARKSLDASKSKPFFPKDLDLPLIAGSGVNVENAAMYKKYVDAVIAGSIFKHHGYWECGVDEENVAKFMEVWKQ